MILGYAKNPKYGGHVPGSEFYKNYLRFAENQLLIVPKKNLISNIGIGAGSEHSDDNLKKLPKAVQKLFYTKTYELDFPLKHPKYFVRDFAYDKYVNRVLAWNHPFVSFYRKVERAVRCLLFGDLKKIRAGIRHQFVDRIEK